MELITDVVLRMQNELRNKEGITGIDAMHHINMIILSKSFIIYSFVINFNAYSFILTANYCPYRSFLCI